MKLNLNKSFLVIAGLFCAAQIFISGGEIDSLPFFLVLFFSSAQAVLEAFQGNAVNKEDQRKLDEALSQLSQDRQVLVKELEEAKNRLEYRMSSVENRLRVVGFSFEEQ